MDTAKARWELENAVEQGGDDAMYRYDEAGQKAMDGQRPWKSVRKCLLCSTRYVHVLILNDYFVSVLFCL